MGEEEIEIIDCGIEPVNQYCRDVLEGNIPTCIWTKRAVQRFQSDIKRQNTDPEFTYYFQPKAYFHFAEFCENYLQHFQGHFAGNPIIWEPHQAFFLSQLFGWLHNERYQDTAVRRFREFSYYVSKKNGKSLISACISLYWMIFESKGSSIACIATAMSHAKKLSYNTCVKMIKHNESLSEIFKVNKSVSDMKITCPSTDSIMQPLPTSADKLDGPLISLIIADETKDVVDHSALDTLVSGQTTVISPLLINISTAGYNSSSVGYTYYERDKKILSGEVEDESVLSIIYGIDEGDEENWDDPDVWRKANPLFGVTVLETYFKSRVKKARENIRLKNEVFIKNLNKWGKSNKGWIDISKWDDCYDPDLTMKDVSDLPCVLTLDFSSTLDLTNCKITFVDESDDHPQFYVFDNFYLPEKRFEISDSKYDDNYTTTLIEWKDQGHIQPCGNESIDYNQVLNDVVGLTEELDCKYIAYDPWHSQQFVNNLKKTGLDENKFVEYSQVGYKNWDSPMRNTESYILEKQIHHNGNKVQRWCIENVTTKSNTYDSIRPEKISADRKIDGVITLIMASGVYEWMDFEPQPEEKKLSPIAQRIMENKKDY